MAVGIGLPFESPLEQRLLQDAQRRLGKLVLAAEIHQEAAVVGQHFRRVEVRRRDDRLPGPERVRKRTAGDLLRVQVGRDVHIAREQVVDDLWLGQILVDEGDVVLEPELLGERPERVSISLALAPHELRVRLADDQVQRPRSPATDRLHRPDHVLQALARVHEPEGGDERPPSQAELLFQPSVPMRLNGRDAVRDHRNFVRRNAVGVQKHPRSIRHYDHPHAASGQALNGLAHGRGGVGQQRVERRDQRLAQLRQEADEVVVEGIAPGAVQPELVLQAHHVDWGAVELDRQGPIAFRASLLDSPPDLRAVEAERSGLVDGRPADADRRVGRR